MFSSSGMEATLNPNYSARHTVSGSNSKQYSFFSPHILFISFMHHLSKTSSEFNVFCQYLMEGSQSQMWVPYGVKLGGFMSYGGL